MFERRVREALARLEQAMARAHERESLAEEIDALRFVLARLLSMEADPVRLASSISRVVDAVGRAVRTERTLSGGKAENLTEALTQVLIELGLDRPR